MSFNLKLEVEGRDFELWQTPTAITNMCLTTKSGIVYSLEGDNARRAMFSYIEYVKGTLNGKWDSKEDLEYAKNSVNNHLKECSKILNSGKEIIVSGM